MIKTNKSARPFSAMNDTPAGERETILAQLQELQAEGKPATDDALDQRLDRYFELCLLHGLCPGVESMAKALSVSRTTVFYWAAGKHCSKRRTESIRAAKGFISAYLEQALLRVSIAPTAAIFLFRNWFGYGEGSAAGEPAPAERQIMTADQIRQKLQDLPE